MLQNSPPRSPILFFISRLLILMGMVLFFMSVFYGIGIFLCKPLFGLPITDDISVLSDYNNPAVLHSLKFLQVFVSIGMFMIPAFYFPKAIQQDPKEFLQADSGFTIKDIALAIGLVMAATPFISWLIYVNQQISFPASMAGLEQQLKAAEEAAKQLTDAFIKTGSIGGLLTNMLIVALVPAICEELLFRGALQQFMYMCFRNTHVAVWFTAIVFSAFHGQFYGFLPRMVLGALLGYMFAYSGSLWVSVIAHFINNMLALLSVFYHWNDSSYPFLREDYIFPVYVNILSFVLCTGIIYLMHVHRKKKIWYNGE